MLDRSTYTADMSQLGYGVDPMVSEEGLYNIDAEAPDPNCPILTCYSLTATPVAGRAQEEDGRCTSFNIRSSGAKTATGSAPDECW
jgi:type IV pilus assembly protein PilE